VTSEAVGYELQMMLYQEHLVTGTVGVLNGWMAQLALCGRAAPD
jgi:hypothetical protein